ncbi:Smr/MutS family protein [Patescibacteria group bacterium]|nr:Smr/MutS family protein [Patescibacteria group bacterium]
MENENFWETLIQIAESDSEIYEIDVHGMHPDLAEKEVDEFLDGAHGAGQRVVKIIHGVGSGALSLSIKKLLQKHWAVLYFRDSFNSGEGGAVKYAVLAQN